LVITLSFECDSAKARQEIRLRGILGQQGEVLQEQGLRLPARQVVVLGLQDHSLLFY
jgi:hypothetical protein